MSPFIAKRPRENRNALSALVSGWACVAAVSTLLLGGCDSGPQQAVEAPPPGVLVAKVARREMSETVDYIGQTVAVNDVSLRTQVEGYLLERTFIEGQDLEEGAELFLIDPVAYEAAEAQFNATQDATVSGELVPIYRDGTGAWKAGLSRNKFSISGVQGKVDAVFLVCGSRDIQLRYPAEDPWVIPDGMNHCKIDVAGTPGTRFTLHQFAP